MPGLTLAALIILFVMTVLSILAWGAARADHAHELVLRKLWQDRADDRLTVMLAERDLLTEIIQDGKAAPDLLDRAKIILYSDIDALLRRHP